MARQIIKQPDGKFSIFSTTVDLFVHQALTWDEVENRMLTAAVKKAEEETKHELERIKAKLDKGVDAYYQFTVSYKEAVELDKVTRECDETDN